MNWAVLALLAAHDAAAAAGDVATAHAYLNGASNSTARNIMGKSLYFFFPFFFSSFSIYHMVTELHNANDVFRQHRRQTFPADNRVCMGRQRLRWW